MDEELPPPLDLETGEALFRELLDGTFEGILLHDDHVLYANAAAGRIIGVPAAEVVGMPMLRLHPTGGPPEALAGGLSYGPFEFGVPTRSEPPAIIEAQGRTVRFRGRWVWLTAFRDVSRHKAAEAELEKRIALEDVVRTISAGFIDLEPGDLNPALDAALEKVGKFAEVDRAYIYMLDGEHLRASNIWARQSEVERFLSRNPGGQFRGTVFPVGSFRWALDRLQRGEHVVYDVLESWDEGDVGTPRSSLCVPLSAGGAMLGYVGFDALRAAATWSDETIRLLRSVGFVFASALQRSQVQLELARAYESMERKVLERTRELTAKQTQLVQAEKMAALGQLVAGVAHEINTPLGAIKSNTDTLLRSLDRLVEALDDANETAAARRQKLVEGARHVNAINVQAIERIVAIVNTLRQFARLDQAEIDTVDLHEAIDNTLTLVQHQLKHRVHVEKDYGDLPRVECYPDQLNQVFMNLLINAGQAIEGKGTITIRTRLEAGLVVFEFRDTGKGIAPEQLPRIFDPGFTTKGVGVGTGLGLSIVQRIIDDHHGRIEVESQRGEGTVFRIRVPVRRPIPEA